MADAGGYKSDLEAPLLISEQPNHDRNHRDSSRIISNEGGKRKWKERPPTNLNRMHSGRWQFKIHKYVEKTDFAETAGLTPAQREYNKKQRETLAGFEEVDAINGGLHQGGELGAAPCLEPEEPGVSRAINLSNGFNFLLLVVKIYAVIKSGSLAILASTLDSLLDMVAGFVLWFAHYYMQKKNRYKYPIGKLRIQPVGIVIFAATMATLGLQVFITGVEQLIEGHRESMGSSERIWLVAIMGLAIFVKLGLYMYCRTFDNEIVNTYAKDHFVDILTNVVGLAAALVGDYFLWWIDPAGAIFLALYTIANWGTTLIENAMSLVGKTAPPEVLQKLTYMALNHHEKIRKIDTVRAYTFGMFYFVEVDIELPEDMLLKEAHEIGESLQNKLERLPEVERAFVHLDHETDHKPEHYAAESKH
ncbi:unnamed protein product [Calypogeia fissa]